MPSWLCGGVAYLNRALHSAAGTKSDSATPTSISTMHHVLYVFNESYVLYTKKMRPGVIAHARYARYDRHTRNKAGKMPNTLGTAADIEQRLNDGAWLKPGEVGVLFGRTRWAVINWLKTGVDIDGQRYYFAWRKGTGGHREIDPADVQDALKAHRAPRETHRAAERNSES